MPHLFKSLTRSDTPSSLCVDIDGRRVDVRIIRSGRATRLTLRQDIRNGGFKLTLPLGIGINAARDMILRHSGWLSAQIKKTPPTVAFVPGVVVPVGGYERMIRHDPATGHRVVMDDHSLTTGGDPSHVPRRVEDFLRSVARRDLSAHVRRHALTLERPVSGVTVRDTVSRWGSCSSSGRISLSWRLILAPEWIASYVAAHEVAHLAEMNHGPRFWRLCRDLHPDTDSARAWLRRHGAALHRYGGGPSGD